MRQEHPSCPKDVDGYSFVSHFTESIRGPRQSVLIHQDPRPGWDKDRFDLIRLALDERFKLYDDDVFSIYAKILERVAQMIGSDDALRSQHRQQLQSVLDATSHYERFDPDMVPRPNPKDESGSTVSGSGRLCGG